MSTNVEVFETLEEVIIECVKTRECLYRKDRLDYRNNVIRKKAFADIAGYLKNNYPYILPNGVIDG